jgi:hypothetical protein
MQLSSLQSPRQVCFKCHGSVLLPVGRTVTRTERTVSSAHEVTTVTMDPSAGKVALRAIGTFASGAGLQLYPVWVGAVSEMYRL